MQILPIATALIVLAAQLGLAGSAMAQSETIEENEQLVSAIANEAPPTVSCQRIGIPAYFGLGPQWDQLVSLGRESDLLIVDLADGPGPGPRADYLAGVQRARESGTKVMGYVYTQFGARDLNKVKADVDNFKNWYAVDGIFIDNMAAGPEMLPYYRELHDYVKSSPGGFIMGNPGVVPDRRYMDTSDVLVVFEDTYQSYLSRPFPAWVNDYSPDRFSHLIYDANDAASMADALRLSSSRNAGYLYVTDGKMPNNWDTLPKYWLAEVDALRRNCWSHTSPPL